MTHAVACMINCAISRCNQFHAIWVTQILYISTFVRVICRLNIPDNVLSISEESQYFISGLFG